MMDVQRCCWVTGSESAVDPPNGSNWSIHAVPVEFPLRGVWPFDVFRTDWCSARGFAQLDRLLADMRCEFDVVVGAFGPADAVRGLFWANGCLRRPAGKLLWWLPDQAHWDHGVVDLTRACRLAGAAVADVAAESSAAADALMRSAYDVPVRVLRRDDADGWRQWLAQSAAHVNWRDRVLRAVHDLMAYPLRVDWMAVPERRRYVCHLLADGLVRILQAGYARCVLYGAGRHTRRLADLLDEVMTDDLIELVGVVDDDPGKRGSQIGRWPVMAVEDLSALRPVAVLISSDAHEPHMWDRRNQFERLGVPVFCMYCRLSSRAEDLPPVDRVLAECRP